MDYRRFGDTLIVRMDPGEEITDRLRAVCEKERVELAAVEALGAVNDFTVGLFDLETKEYRSNRFQGPHEIVSLTGTVTTKEGKFYQHLHMSAANAAGEVFGGHLSAAVISATCEMVVRVLDGQVERALDPEIGINLFRFL